MQENDDVVIADIIKQLDQELNGWIISYEG